MPEKKTQELSFSGKLDVIVGAVESLMGREKEKSTVADPLLAWVEERIGRKAPPALDWSSVAVVKEPSL